MSKRYILYLEPSFANPLWQYINEYFELTKRKIGINEAQQYRPHCSITGFFEISRKIHDEFKVLSLICEEIEEKLKSEYFSVNVGSVEIDAEENGHRSNPSVRIGLKTYGFKELAESLKKRMVNVDVNIRPKPADHISLAYIANYPIIDVKDDVTVFSSVLSGGKGDLVSFSLEPYFDLAKKYLAGHCIDSNDWNLVLHEEVHSSHLLLRHDFLPIKEWPLKSILRKSYPDR